MRTDEIEAVLRGLDPARGVPPLAGPERREHDRLAILSRAQTVRRPTRRLVLAGAGAAVLGGAALIVAAPLVRRSPAPVALEAVIGMPDPLAITRADRKPSAAADELERIAAHAGVLGEPATGTTHLTYTSWDLSTMVGQGRTTSIVIPTRTDLVRRPDGSATMTTVHTKPLLRTQADRDAWNREGRPGASSAPERDDAPSFAYPGTAPATTAAMAEYLRHGHPPENGPAEVLIAITDLVREQALGPAQRAAVLRVLATVPGLQYAGDTVDRNGRHGAAFILRNAHGGLRNDLTLVVDPATGRILDEVQVLLEAGRLNIKVPMVTGYTAYDEPS
jgi:hypothetical protein